MSITNIISLLGGLALFLYGMQMMSSGLEAAAGNRMKKILERLTANRFLGVLVGAGITAVIQSSSATTVMVVGFVNAGMMTLKQAVWIIMGANIGTTVTGLLIALDVGALAPLIAFVGVALIVFIKNTKVHHWAHIVAGLGILFIGMEMMSGAMKPLREYQPFIDLMSSMTNPLLGILFGAGFTALIQSSSASVGIMQGLAYSGAILGLDQAVFILFGQNIGTCITAILASIGTGRSAKRTTVIHLSFNIIGTVIFTAFTILIPGFVGFIETIIPGNTVSDIAGMHTIFNITTTVLLIPFGTPLAKLATKILPEREYESETELSLHHIRPVSTFTDYSVGNSAIVINGVKKELIRMTEMVSDNIEKSYDAVLAGSPEFLESVEKTEEYIDYLNKEISKYISQIISLETNETDSERISAYFRITGNLERIGDHAVNICEYTKMLSEKEIKFSDIAREEITRMKEISLETLAVVRDVEKLDVEKLSEIAAFEQRIDDMTDAFKVNQLARMHSGVCSDEACIIYSELLTDFERVGDHILNIGQALAAIE
ncbi:MAG: Na/Pi cotransporter family protein [Clostridia bacterium]|nr:Na/Pi cotransporter family protein [Clostridia bacterium]